MGTARAVASLFALAALTSCAHQPGAFRLTAPANAAPTLIPPGVRNATVARASLQIAPILRKTVCSPSPHGLTIQRRWLGGTRLIVRGDAINASTATELFAWAVELEKQGCIPPDRAFSVAESIIDALPLSLAKRRELLQGRTDLKSVNSLNVIAPVIRQGGSGKPAVEVTSVAQGASPASIDIEVKSDPSVIGYEVDWYDLTARDSGPGFRIVPRGAEIHVDGKVEHPAAPSTSRFQFGPDARWYELFMMTKVSSNDFDFVVFSARTSAELQTDIAEFQRDATAFLQNADPGSYSVLPHGTGINAYIKVKVNGVALDLPRGNTVRQAIAQSKADPGAIPPTLKVSKLHDGKLFPVDWGRASDRILTLPLEGGEEISW
jgi:hypothetical protein